MSVIANRKVIQWFLNGKTGNSSKAIVSQMTCIDTSDKGIGDHPHDGGDFGRCHNLLEIVPEYRERIKEMSERSPEWAALVAHWDELTRLHCEDGNVYDRMRQILDAVPNKRGVQIADGVTVYTTFNTSSEK